MIMSDALCGSSISYSPLSFITSRTLTTAPPFRTSPEEMAAVWAGMRERGVCGNSVSTTLRATQIFKKSTTTRFFVQDTPLSTVNEGGGDARYRDRIS